MQKTLSELKDFIYTLEKYPSVIGKTKLNENSVSNIEMLGYKFYHSDSVTSAGGAALYISKTLHSAERPDIKLDIQDVESCWAEIVTENGHPPIIVGSIYRHPNSD